MAFRVSRMMHRFILCQGNASSRGTNENKKTNKTLKKKLVCFVLFKSITLCVCREEEKTRGRNVEKNGQVEDTESRANGSLVRDGRRLHC